MSKFLGVSITVEQSNVLIINYYCDMRQMFVLILDVVISISVIFI